MLRNLLLAGCAIFLGCSTDSTTAVTSSGTPSTGPVLKANTAVAVPAGASVRLGSSDATLPADERPDHTVALDAFYMTRYEVPYHQLASVFNSQMSGDSGYTAVDTLDGPAYDTILLLKYKNTGLRVAGNALTLASCTLLLAVTDTLRFTAAESLGLKDTVKHEIPKYILSRALAATDAAVNLPATRVSWYGAAAFCNFLSLQEGLDPAYDAAWSLDTSKNGWRLPTEAEWEYAARGNRSFDSSYFPTGLTLDPLLANVQSTFVKPVGSYAANPFGIHDLAGNVWEWCTDNYDAAYYSSIPARNPVNLAAPDSLKALRGGCFKDEPASLRSARRAFSARGLLSAEAGFRVVRPSR